MKLLIKKSCCNIFILLIICIQFSFSQSKKIVKQSIDVSPLWIIQNYALYWGITLSGGITIMKHNKISLCADIAPLGSLCMTDIDTDGKVEYWGGTLSYLFQIELINKLLRIEPGATTGIYSKPYIYGTFYLMKSPFDTTSNTSNSRPEREIVWGAGPELRISLGRKNVQLFTSGRILFGKNDAINLLTNLGVSIKL